MASKFPPKKKYSNSSHPSPRPHPEIFHPVPPPPPPPPGPSHCTCARPRPRLGAMHLRSPCTTTRAGGPAKPPPSSTRRAAAAASPSAGSRSAPPPPLQWPHPLLFLVSDRTLTAVRRAVAGAAAGEEEAAVHTACRASRHGCAASGSCSPARTPPSGSPRCRSGTRAKLGTNRIFTLPNSQSH